ncbi:hypothetical protein VTN96DRAFT_993 [Rasamsonia emersonii]
MPCLEWRLAKEKQKDALIYSCQNLEKGTFFFTLFSITSTYNIRKKGAGCDRTSPALLRICDIMATMQLMSQPLLVMFIGIRNRLLEMWGQNGRMELDSIDVHLDEYKRNENVRLESLKINTIPVGKREFRLISPECLSSVLMVALSDVVLLSLK